MDKVAQVEGVGRGARALDGGGGGGGKEGCLEVGASVRAR